MSGPNDIAAEMDAIGAVIKHARDRLIAGDLIDVSPVERRVETLCDGLEKLRDGEGASLRPALAALIDEFSQLAGLINTRLEGLRENLKLSGEGALAISAYSQAARADKPKT